MKIIVAVDENWGIGKGNDLLFSIPEDMKFFRTQTTGKVIIVGRKTLQSFPGGKPLKNRTNVVLSRSGEWEGVISVKDIPSLMREISHFSSEDVFVCGGASVYKELLPYCDTALVTKVAADGGAEVFFSNLDADSNWVLESEGSPIFDNGYSICFCSYKNVNVKQFE